MYQFFTFLCNFCQLSKDFVDQNVQYDQHWMISLSNRVVCGDYKDNEIVNKFHFFYIFVFSNATFVKTSTFSWIKTLEQFNNNWRRSPVGFLMGYVPVSDKKIKL